MRLHTTKLPGATARLAAAGAGGGNAAARCRARARLPAAVNVGLNVG